MNYLITGGTGYIGSNVASALCKKKHKVYLLAREPVNRIYVEDFISKVTILPYDGNFESVRKAVEISKPDIVYHFATLYTQEHKGHLLKSLLDSNLLLGSFVMEAMAELKLGKLIYATSTTCYDELGNYCPQTLYAATKHAFFDMLQYYTSSKLIQAITIVLSDTYGTGDHRSKILNLIKKASKSKTSITLSDGQQKMNYLYVSDVVQAFIHVAQFLVYSDQPHQIYQIRGDETYSLREIVEKMLAVNDVYAKLQWGMHRPPTSPIDAVEVFPVLPNWRPKICLKDGLQLFWKE